MSFAPTAERPTRGRPPESFHAIMARELARAPWFLLSLALHLILLLLLRWLVVAPPLGQGMTGQIEVVLARESTDRIEADAPPEEKVDIEVSDNEATEEPLVEVDYAIEPKAPEPSFDESVFATGLDTLGLTAVRGNKAGGSGQDVFSIGSEALRRGTLSRTVAGLRRSGLEIVFVFDSTGSMDRVLDSAKRRIGRMVEVLHALVPRARIGIVTYRDRGRAEDYVTRSVPVTHDVYRVMNFMHTIQAGGGGDFEEAVLDGMRAAATQTWLPESRRVVVLIGDAPPHKDEERTLTTVVQGFARGQAFVHAIATGDRGREAKPHPDTKRAFTAVARNGKGEFSLLEGNDTILQQVLALAFGSDSRRDLDEIYALVDKQSRKTDVAALDAVQRGDLAVIEKGLRHDPVDDHVVKAVLRIQNPKVTRFLVEKLGDRGFPAHGRQACSYAVMQLLGLARPPLDPECDEVLRGRALDELLRQAQ